MFSFDAPLLLAAAPISGSRVVLACCLLGMLCAMWAGAWHGYWAGPVRQLAPTISLVIAGAGAWLFGADFGFLIFNGTFVPWLLRGFVGMALLGSVLWLIAFAILWRLGRNRFPNPTGECENPVLGAIVGCWTGILWSTVGFLVLGGIGAVAQLWIENTGNAPGGAGRFVLVKLVTVKNSLALINGAEWLETWNPLPEHTRRLLEKGLRVVNTPGALNRLQRLEEIQNLATNAAFFPLAQDPEIQLLIKQRNIEKLVSHPAILRLLSDDNFQQLVVSTNLEQSLDEALRQVEVATPENRMPNAATQ